MSRIDPATLAALAASTVAPRRIEVGVTTLDPSPREWRNRVRMTKDERERAERSDSLGGYTAEPSYASIRVVRLSRYR